MQLFAQMSMEDSLHLGKTRALKSTQKAAPDEKKQKLITK
jgi:hypothetical protein